MFTIMAVFLLVMSRDVSEVSVLGFKLDDARTVVSVLPVAVAYLSFERNHVGSEITYYRSIHQEVIRQRFPAIYRNRLSGGLMMPTIAHETMSLFPYVPVTLRHYAVIALSNSLLALLGPAFLVYAYVELFSTFGASATVLVSVALAAVFCIRTAETVAAEQRWNRAAMPPDENNELDSLPEPFRTMAKAQRAKELGPDSHPGA